MKKRMLGRLGVYINNFGFGRYCPICKMFSRKFGKFGVQSREDVRCHFCGSLERHRLVWQYFKKKTNLFDGHSKRILHVAPESFFSKKFRKFFHEGYFSVDLDGSRAMEKMDITSMPFPEGSFDVIYCSHVLEHVPEDRKAMNELHRVIKKEGWCCLLVPMSGPKTLEDTTVIDPLERQRLFGQSDHVRLYGEDFIERLKDVGFKVKIYTAQDICSARQIKYMRLPSGNIYHCKK